MEKVLSDLMSKVRAIVEGHQGDLFAQIVDSFYEQIGEEHFSPEDLTDIQEGIEEIRRGEVIPWEECKRKHGL